MPARLSADPLFAYPPAPPLPNVISTASDCSSTGTVIVRVTTSLPSALDALDDIDGAERVSDEEELSARHLSARNIRSPYATPPSSPPAIPRGTRRSLELGVSCDGAMSLDYRAHVAAPAPRRRLRLALPRVRRRAREPPLPARFAALREDASDFLDEADNSGNVPAVVPSDSARAARKSSLVARLAGGALRRRRRRAEATPAETTPPAEATPAGPSASAPAALSMPAPPRPATDVVSLRAREESRRTPVPGRRARLLWIRPAVAPDVKRAGSFVRNVSMAKDDFIDFATSAAATHRGLWRVRRVPRRPVAARAPVARTPLIERPVRASIDGPSRT
eukprot:IDg19673t1